jgi:hypothetical protein
MTLAEPGMQALQGYGAAELEEHNGFQMAGVSISPNCDVVHSLRFFKGFDNLG